MSNKWRRYEVVLPLKRNDGRWCRQERIAEAFSEVSEHFGSTSVETSETERRFQRVGVQSRGNSLRIIVDVLDSAKTRAWMRRYKARWKGRLELPELSLVSYRIEVE